MSKTQLEEINQNIYDFKNADNFDFKMEKGLSEKIVRDISKQKKEITYNVISF